MGLHRLFSFGTKKSQLKNPDIFDFGPALLHFCPLADAMPPIGRGSCEDWHSSL